MRFSLARAIVDTSNPCRIWQKCGCVCYISERLLSTIWHANINHLHSHYHCNSYHDRIFFQFSPISPIISRYSYYARYETVLMKYYFFFFWFMMIPWEVYIFIEYESVKCNSYVTLYSLTHLNKIIIRV